MKRVSFLILLLAFTMCIGAQNLIFEQDYTHPGVLDSYGFGSQRISNQPFTFHMKVYSDHIDAQGEIFPLKRVLSAGIVAEYGINQVKFTVHYDTHDIYHGIGPFHYAKLSHDYKPNNNTYTPSQNNQNIIIIPQSTYGGGYNNSSSNNSNSNRCLSCHGSGICQTCEGTGKISVGTQVCTTCWGTKKCVGCKGEGYYR